MSLETLGSGDVSERAGSRGGGLAAGRPSLYPGVVGREGVSGAGALPGVMDPSSAEYAGPPLVDERRGSGLWLRVTLTLTALAFLTLFVLVPAVNVFAEAFKKGPAAYKAVFFPPPPDEARLAAIRGRLAEIDELPFRQQRAAREEQRGLEKEEGVLLDPGERAKRNWAAVRLTLGIVAVVVPLNMVFGVAAAWAITKFRFKGRSLLVSVIDLPFSVSPVLAGLIFVLLFGMQGFMGAWSRSDNAMWLVPAVRAVPRLAGILSVGWVVWNLGRAAANFAGLEIDARVRRMIGRGLLLVAVVVVIGTSYVTMRNEAWSWGWILPTDWKWWSPAWRGFGAGHWWPFTWEPQEGVIFTPAAIVMASVFVTFPFVARALIPLMESQGVETEQAALTLGASGRYTFWRVTLPSIKWGLVYGGILCTARALGEFGAVSVVSGHVESNDTMPLRVEKLWQSYQTQEAFAVASVLALLAVVTLLLKTVVEWRTGRAEDAGEPKPVLAGGKR